MLTIYQDMPLNEREEQLQKMAAKTEKRTYRRTLQQSEVDAERNKYTSNAIDLQVMEEELENLKKDYTAKIKAHEAMMKERLDKIKNGKEDISGNLYGLPNYQNSRMMFYDKYGELIDSRDLLPEEIQTKMQFTLGAGKVTAETINFEEIKPDQQGVDGTNNAVGGSDEKEKEQPQGEPQGGKSVADVMAENAKKNTKKSRGKK